MAATKHTPQAYTTSSPAGPFGSGMTRRIFLNRFGAAAALAFGALSLEPLPGAAAPEAAVLGPLQGRRRREEGSYPR